MHISQIKHIFLAIILSSAAGMTTIAADATTGSAGDAATANVSGATPPNTGDTVVCPTCGRTMPASFHFCGNCGTNLDNVPRQNAGASGDEKPVQVKRSLFGFLIPQEPVNAKTVKEKGVDNSLFSDKPLPLQTAEVPPRPKPIVEMGGSPFLSNGPIQPGITLPTGAVWQPEFLVFGDARMAFQTFDNGKTQYTEYANLLDLYGNLYLTPTERVLIGFHPLDRDGNFTGYDYHPDKGVQDYINARVHTLFFEGDFGQLFPKLDPNNVKSLDYGFAIGRQPLSFEDGIMISDDSVDAIGITRTSLFALGASALHTTALFGWDDLYRNDGQLDNTAKLFGLFSTADYSKSTINLDLAYVNAASGDGFYAGVGATQRFFGHMDTTFRVNTSVALDQQSPAVSTGTLLFGQLSTILPHSKDVVYLDSFLGIDNYSSAARDPYSGGPLGDTGILFAAQGLGRYGAPLGNYANRSAGSALGWQHYLGSTDQQIVFELGGRANTGTTQYFSQSNNIAAGARYQLKLNQHSVLQFDAFFGFPEDAGTSWGLRSELLIKF